MKLLWIFISILMISCSAKVNDLHTAEGTFDEGNRLLDDGFYEEARTQFYRIKTEFSNSDLVAQADLRVADSYFEEESFQTAASSYEDFVRTYPGHPKIPYALHRAGKSYMELMPSHPQRDSRSTEKAIDIYTRLIVDYPDSEYIQEADENIQKAQDQIAQKLFQIARFYERQKKFEAAAQRFARVRELFSDHALAEEAFARQIRSLTAAGNKEAAEQLLQNFENLYPNSKHRSLISL